MRVVIRVRHGLLRPLTEVVERTRGLVCGGKRGLAGQEHGAADGVVGIKVLARFLTPGVEGAACVLAELIEVRVDGGAGAGEVVAHVAEEGVHGWVGVWGW